MLNVKQLREAVNTKVKSFGLIGQGIEPQVYQLRDGCSYRPRAGYGLPAVTGSTLLVWNP